MFRGNASWQGSSFALVAFLGLTGCAVHAPRVVQPPPDMPVMFAGEEAFQEHVLRPDVSQWWHVFGDDRLNALMQELFNGNYDLQAAQTRLERALAAVDAAGAARSPSLTLEASGGRQRRLAVFGPQITDAYRLSAAAAYEIDLWGKLSAREQTAMEDAEASGEDLRALRVSLSATLADVYHLAAEAQAQIDLNDRAAIHAAHTLDLTQRRYGEGLVPLLDVHQARQNLARIKAQRPTHEIRLTQSRLRA